MKTREHLNFTKGLSPRKTVTSCEERRVEAGSSCAPVTGSDAGFKPQPRWHEGMQEWVLTMEPQTKAFINVRRADGLTHHAAVELLWVEQPNAKLSDRRKEMPDVR